MNFNTTSLAKITRPNISRVLPRERLFSLLDQGREQSIIWLTGPPGSGKTTLVSNYTERRKLDCLWYQMDQGDMDIATFFYYLRQATLKGKSENNSPLTLSDIDSSLSGQANRYFKKIVHRINVISSQLGHLSLHSPKVGKLLPKFEYIGNIATFTRGYFRHVFEQLKTPFLVVFDGYHEVPTHSEFHDVISHGFSEIPAGGCVVLISRNEPPAAMARFRANQKMCFINWDDLRLSQEESNNIVKLRGHKLSDEELVQLYNKTQGWAAGLVLMLEHIGSEDTISISPDTFIPQVIFDYIAGEIFQGIDKKTQDFLLQTAYLPQMTDEMAIEVTKIKTADSFLHDLCQNNNFVTEKTISNKTIYEYHPLYREFLLSISKKSLKIKEIADRQRNAAILLESNGQIEEAIEILVDISEWELLKEIIHKHAEHMLEYGRGETLAQWLNDLPKEVMNKDPWLLYWLGSCHLQFELRQSRIFYERAYKLFNNKKNPDIKGLILSCSGVINAILHELDDLTLLDQWIGPLREHLQNYPESIPVDSEAHVTYCMFTSLLLRQSDNPDSDIGYWVDRAFTASLSCPNNKRVSVQLFVSIAYMWGGMFNRAREIIDAINKMETSPEISPLNLTLLKYVDSMCFMLMGKRALCLKTVDEGVKYAQESGVTIWKYHTLINGVGAALGAGDLEIAQQLLDQIESEQVKGRRQEQCLYYYFHAWADILNEDKLSAYQHQKTALRLSIEVGNPFFEMLCRLAMAQILFENGDERRGAMHLRQVRASARDLDNPLLEYLSFLTYAYLALDYGKRFSGLKSLKYAMEVGRENMFMTTLWWRPEIMSRLCATALQEKIETDYVKTLIRKRRLVLPDTSSTIEEWPWLIKIYTFGQCRFQDDEQRLGFTAKLNRKPLELFKVIIAYGGTEIDEGILAETLWPGVDSEYSLRSLTTTIHRLRKFIGDDRVILVQDRLISLDKKYCWLDVWAFENLAQEIDLLISSGQNNIGQDQVTRLIEKIFQLYRGPFMASEADKIWYISPREKLRDKFLHSLNSIAHYLEKRGDFEKALECYQQGIKVDNLAEGLYRGLMLCYRKLGRKAEAIEIYERCRKTLASVLKTSPSRETMILYENILTEL